MKAFLAACCAVALVAVTLSQDAPAKEGDNSTDRPTIFQRLIPADVLRGKIRPLTPLRNVF